MSLSDFELSADSAMMKDKVLEQQEPLAVSHGESGVIKDEQTNFDSQQPVSSEFIKHDDSEPPQTHSLDADVEGSPKVPTFRKPSDEEN